MNWFDLVIIATLVVSGLIGMSIGLLGAAIAALGVIAGWLLASRFGEHLSPLLGAFMPEYWALVMSYSIFIVLTLAAAGMVKAIVLPALSMATFGLSDLLDRAGGLLLGLVIGLLIVGILVSGPRVVVIPLWVQG
jgi:uncharacterized membrane protein required for colicin V production